MAVGGSGDYIGVYVPVFATAGRSGIVVYCVVFLALVAVWCLLGRLFAGHPTVANVLARWGHILLPIVLIVIGVVILVEGGAFGL
jgi:cadmium resistance protein CadD (predicted permease)